MSSNAGKRTRVIWENKENPIDLSKSAGGPAKKMKASRALPHLGPLPNIINIPYPVSGDADTDRRIIGRACHYADLMDTFGKSRKLITSSDAMRCINEIVEEVPGVTVDSVKTIVKRLRVRLTCMAKSHDIDRQEVIEHFKMLSKE